MYCICRNFCQEKIFANFAHACRWRKFFPRIFLSSEKFLTLRSDQLFFLASTSSSTSLLSYFQVAPWRDLPSPSCRTAIIVISEPNAAVNRAAQRARENKKRGAYIKLDETAKIRLSKYSSAGARMGSARQRGISLWS